MFSLLIDQKETQLGSPLPTTIESLVITKHPMVQMPIEHNQAQQIADWLYKAAQRSNHISYNGTIMDKEAVNKYKVP